LSYDDEACWEALFFYVIFMTATSSFRPPARETPKWKNVRLISLPAMILLERFGEGMLPFTLFVLILVVVV
jgi:hypothetical protein